MSMNQLSDERQAGAIPLIKTATATLTIKELLDYKMIRGAHASTPIVLTLPAPSSVPSGTEVRVINGGAQAVTVIDPIGYGGNTSTKTITLARGDMAILRWDGTYVYQTSTITATT